MKAILHIGIEKTGTTAIQAFLTDNRVSLQAQGYAYLESAGLPSNRKIATYCIDPDRHDDHHELLQIVDAEPRKAWNDQFVKDFHAEIESLENSIHTVVISNEQLHSRLLRPAEIERVKLLLEDYFDEIRVVVYLRRQDQLATSLYSTALKCGHSFDSILPGVTAEDHYYNFQVLLEKWGNVFGDENITARLFDRAELVNGDLLTDFLQHSEMSSVCVDELILPGRQNESLEPKAQEFLRVANQYIPMIVDGRFNILRARLTQQLEAQFSGKPGLPPKQEALMFCEKFSNSNRVVAQKWFAREELFSNDFSAYPDNSTELQHSFEDAVYVASTLLNGQMQNELEATETLLVKLQQAPSETTKNIADYFESINPQLANHLRQNGVNPPVVNAGLRLVK